MAAAIASSASALVLCKAPTVRSVQLRSAAPADQLAMLRGSARTVASKGALGARADYLGSPTNLIVVSSTALFLAAARFGLAPSANREASAGLKLSVRDTGLQSGDPAGFTATDVLAYGTIGHVVAIGTVLGLKAIGAL